MKKADLRDTVSASPKSTQNWPIYQRPGFLIRRLHQIHVGLFATICGDFNVTPLQYTVLSALGTHGPADQTTIANVALLDRATTTDIIKRLVKRHLVKRRPSTDDRRSQLCSLTNQGVEFLVKVEQFVKRAHMETVKPLTPKEQAALIRLMAKIVTRTPQADADQRIQKVRMEKL